MTTQLSPAASSGLPTHDYDPYVLGRQEWAEQFGSHIKEKENWRTLAVIAVVIALIATAGCVYALTQNRFIPYVVAVDRLGVATAVGRADQATKADTRIIRAELAQWVAAARSVYVDAAAQRSVIDAAYAKVTRGSPAFQELNGFYREKSPFERAQTETVTVEVQTVLALSANTWRVEWIEVTRGRNGEELRRENWQAAVSITVAAPNDEPTILRNPLGIYIPEFSWTRRQL